MALTRTLMGLLASLAAGAGHAAEFDFKLHHFLSELSSSHTDTIVPWVERVEANSGGRIDIEIYSSMTLGGRPNELVSQVRDGVVDLVWVVNGYTPGLFPRTEVFELPTVYRNDPAAANLAMREMFAEDLAQDYDDLAVMFLHVHAGNGLHLVDTPVRTPVDLAGLTLRTPSRTGAWVIEALGANPVAMPVPDLPQALSRKLVDGALLPWDIVPAFRLQEQARIQVDGFEQIRLGTTTFQLSMNLARWESLPEDIRKAFTDASGPDWLAELGGIWRRADDAGIDISREAGVDYSRLTESETAAFETALAPVADRWIADMAAAGIDGAALVTRARARIAAHADAAR